MAGNNIDAVFAAIIEDCQTVAAEAVKDAAKKIQKDMTDEAENTLQKYYASYSPKQYSRTERLRRAILPYWADGSNKSGTAIRVGVQYKSSALQGAYRSNSWYHQNGDSWIDSGRGDFNFNSPNNGIPEPSWILENFLEGIHPRTYRSTFKSEDSQYEYTKYVYDPKKTVSPYQLMQEYVDNQLIDKAAGYLEDSFLDALISRLS